LLDRIRREQGFTGFLPALLAAAALFSAPSSSVSASLYKWVDEDGNVRYSDRLPPSVSKKQHQQLNSQGMVVTTREAAKSQDELAAEAEVQRLQAEKAAEEARQKKIQDQQDQVLLMTFSSEEELELARENRLAVLNSVIGLINNSIETTQEKLADLQDGAERNFLSQGKEVPGGLAQKIEFFTRKIETRIEQLNLKLAEKAKINEKYDTDLARYRELKAEPRTN
jgi:hypothetical protein